MLILTRLLCQGSDLYQFKTWLRPWSLATRREELSIRRTPGTCAWSLTHDYLKTWLDSSASQEANTGVWIFGKPGSGKSILSEFLVEHLLQSRHLGPWSGAVCEGNTQNNEPCPIIDPGVRISVLYFFCQGKEEIELSSIFRTMINQLLQQHPESQKLHLIALQFQKDHDDASVSELLDFLLKLIDELKGA
jgi:Cdc6-like AAA superfamily ATPase